MTTTSAKQKPSSGFFPNLIFNIAIPTLILMKLSDEDTLGPAWGIVVALAFPILYGLWDLKKSGKVNGFSILGIISVTLTGGISLLELDPKYIAIKEAAIPGIIGLGVLFTRNTKWSVLKVLLLNPELLDVDNLHQEIEKQGNQARFENKLRFANVIVASSFFLSSALNYILARIILVSSPGTAAYNEELGKMTALSYPVIVIPSMIILIIAIWYLFAQIKKLSGQSLEHFMLEQ